jgi:prepilin-type N-terminal cleavage/methylation domain-containing protein
MRKTGFTLAEVLITLSIIGVVAALTIPTLVINYQDTANAVAAKKAYSEIANAWNLYRANHNGEVAGTYNGIFELKDNFLKKHFSYVSEASYLTNIHTIQNLYNTDTVDIQSGIYKTNGMFFGFQNANPDCFSNEIVGYCAQMWIDVNGKKGPNKKGFDVFFIALMTDGILPYDPRYTETGIKNTQCIKPGNVGGSENTNTGAGCLKRILENKPKWSG